MPYTYIVKCSDGSLYTGWTMDLNKRLDTHNKGKGAKYTRCRLPVELVYWEYYDTKSEAQRREIQIKKISRLQKLKLINTK